MLVCQFVSLSIWQRSLGLGIWDWESGEMDWQRLKAAASPRDGGW